MSSTPPFNDGRDLGMSHLLDACMARVNDVILITEAEPIDEPGPRIVYVNPAFERLTGYSRDEVIGRSPRFLQGPRTSRAALDRIRQALRDKRGIREELINYTKSGREFWLEIDIAHVADAENRITHAIAIERDITERKRAEEELRLANEALIAVVASLQEIGKFNGSLDQTLTLMARHAQGVTRAAGAVVEVLDGSQMIYRAASGTMAEKVGFTLELEGSLSGHAVRQDEPLLCPDTETDGRVNRSAARELGIRSMIVVPLRDDAVVVGALKVVSDLPGTFAERDRRNLEIMAETLGALIRRREATDRLRASEEQYRMLFDGNPHPMMACDEPTGRILAVNAAAISRYGYSEAEFLRLAVRDLCAPGCPREVELPTGMPGSDHQRIRRIRHRTKNGEVFDVELSTGSILFEGRPARLLLADDISERVRSEENAARAGRALRMLTRCNEALARASDERSLLQEVCRIAVEVGGFLMAWVGYALDDDGKPIVPQAFAGAEAGYLSAIRLSWSEADPSGRGPAGQAVRTGKPTVLLDLTNNDRGFFFSEEALKRHYRGVACLPLRANDRTYGVLALYTGEDVSLPEEELLTLQDMADDLAFGIRALQSQSDRRRTYEAMLATARGISSAAGPNFFGQLTTSLVEALAAGGGLVGKLEPKNSGLATTLCVIQDGTAVGNFSFPMEALPQECLQESDLWVVAKNAARFPRCRPPGCERFESFVARRLTGTSGSPLGLMLVHFPEPLERADMVASTLKIFSARAATEIERQAADAKTREQAALLDKAHDAINVRDLAHRITYWNKSSELLYGWTAAEAIGRSAAELIYPDRAPLDRATVELLQAGEWNGEFEHRKKDGRLLSVEARWTLLRDEAGRPHSVLAINTDITERNAMQRQLLRNQRMESIGTLAGGIAHDLNNLLAPITMGVDLLQASPETPPGFAPVLESIRHSAERGARLVRQVLSFARGIDSDKVALNVRPVIREVESIVENTFPKNIALESDVPHDLPPIVADPTQIHQVLLNLCVNARDAMPNGGRLTIRVRESAVDEQYAATNRMAKAGRYIAMEVTDTGSGMTKEVMDRIFEPFFTTKSFGQGTGLGLATVMAVAKSHGGFVNVYSEPGRGSTFKIYLPVQPGVVEPKTPEAESAPPPGRGEMVLVVDDEAAIRDVTQRTLESAGYRVITAEDGAQAISRYAENRNEVIVVLTDMMMPVMDGAALCTSLRRLDPGIRILAASGLEGADKTRFAESLGVVRMLSKPYSARVLLQAVREAIDGT